LCFKLLHVKGIIMVQLTSLCSIDSFLAAAAMSLAGCPNRYRRRLVFSFMAWDTLASVAGASLRVEISTVAVALSILAGVIILVNARRTPALYLLVPAVLCLDNFASGALGATAMLELRVVLGGLCSGILAWAGFLAGNHMARSWKQTMARFRGTMALLAALLA
jgi:hypothetical protein